MLGSQYGFFGRPHRDTVTDLFALASSLALFLHNILPLFL